MFIYLASRFSRNAELNKYRKQIERDGHIVTSRWLLGDHNWEGINVPLSVAERFAREDLEDIDAAEIVVCFTEEARTGPTRGGRHVEYGYALARGKAIIIVGPVENVFYAIDNPMVKRVGVWKEAREIIKEEEELWKVMRGLISHSIRYPRSEKRTADIMLSSSRDTDIGMTLLP